MRRKKEAVLTFAWNNDHLPKTVRQYPEKYKTISQILDENSEILDRVHQDLEKLSQRGVEGREADFTSEAILRAVVVHAMEGLSLRETVIRIAESDTILGGWRLQRSEAPETRQLGQRFALPQPPTIAFPFRWIH